MLATRICQERDDTEELHCHAEKCDDSMDSMDSMTGVVHSAKLGMTH